MRACAHWNQKFTQSLDKLIQYTKPLFERRFPLVIERRSPESGVQGGKFWDGMRSGANISSFWLVTALDSRVIQIDYVFV